METVQNETRIDASQLDEDETEEAKVISPPANAWSQRKAWSGVFNPAAASSSSAATSTDGLSVSTLGKANSESVAEVLRSFNAVSNDSKVAFLEPRGLVNTGNMCYMNSVSLTLFCWRCHLTYNIQVLQVLVFCTPFYNFLDQVGKRATHSFNSDTPLVDAM